MEHCLSFKQQMLMTLYRQGVGGLRERLVLGLPRDTAEWAHLAREVVAHEEGALRSEVVRQLLEPDFLEGHPHSEDLAETVVELLADPSSRVRCRAARFIADHLRLFPVERDSFQLRVMGLQVSPDPRTAQAAEDLLDKIGVDLRDPALFGDTHDSMAL